MFELDIGTIIYLCGLVGLIILAIHTYITGE